ncbi:MAG: MarR family transcriptional regulator [Devosia sp.]|nr:MarR family transcriptional regulator [Devosia sp.]
MADDFTQCMVSNSRMAARAITRRYDSYLRPHGLTATQFSLLGALKLAGAPTVSELAEARGFERTTLTRNMGRLERMGLIASRDAEKGNGRICALTARGDELIAQLLPLWRKAQAEMKQTLTEEGFDASLKVLKRLAKV